MSLRRVFRIEDFARGSELYTGYALDGIGQSPNDDEVASVPDLDRGVALSRLGSARVAGVSDTEERPSSR